MNDRSPPVDVDAEQSVIASLLVDATAMDAVATIVDAADFHRDQHRWAFEGCRSLHQRNETINQVTLAHELARAGRLDDCGGPAWLSRIVAELPTPIGVEHYAGIVRRDSTYRSLITAGSEIVRLAYAGGPDLQGALERSESLIRSVAGATSEPGLVSLARAVEEFWEVGDMHTADIRFSVRSGFSAIDALVGGFESGNLVIVAARPSTGKSALLLNFALNAARGQNARVVIATLEMNRREWATRTIARDSGIDSRRLRPGCMTDIEERRAMNSTAALAGLSVELADATSQSATKLRSEVKKAAAKMGGVDLVIVDYLQLMHGERRGANRTEEVTEISRGLKVLAGELNIPVVAAAQLSRAVEARTPPVPILSDLRDSGAIEQDADVVVFLYRPETDDGRPGEMVKAIIAKNRNGPLGSVWMRMTPATSAFVEIPEVSR